MSNQSDRRAFDIAASGEAQSNFNTIADRLESLMDQRDADVKAAMSNYQADGVSEEYAAKEAEWNRVAGEVRSTIRTLRSALERNDESARSALSKAKAAVDAI